MTRVIDKRNVFIVAKGSNTSNAQIKLLSRDKDINSLYYKKHDVEINIGSGEVVSYITTPDMIAVVETFPKENPNVKAYFNGVEAPATEVDLYGNTCLIWGLKSQDFVVFDFSVATA